jgi:predicted ATP-dependent protease
MIPHSNVQNLMLKEEVVEAVRAGRFHVWAIKSIDQGIEILTGVPAGRRGGDGTYEEGTVHDLANRQLAALAERMRAFTRPEGTNSPPRAAPEE